MYFTREEQRKYLSKLGWYVKMEYAQRVHVVNQIIKDFFGLREITQPLYGYYRTIDEVTFQCNYRLVYEGQYKMIQVDLEMSDLGINAFIFANTSNKNVYKHRLESYKGFLDLFDKLAQAENALK